MTDIDPFVFSEEVFNPDDYLYFYEDTLRTEQTPVQVDTLIQEMSIEKQHHILDVGCGHGRHALEFAQRGYKVTGIDRVQAFLDTPQAMSALQDLPADFMLKDARELSDESAFDIALCLFDAFGFHNDADNIKVLQNIARALKPGGKFCLDVRNRDWIVRHILPVTVAERDGEFMIDRHLFDSASGRLVDQRVIARKSGIKSTPFSIRLYALSELQLLLGLCGLQITAAYGSWQRHSVSLQHNRLLVFSTKI